QKEVIEGHPPTYDPSAYVVKFTEGIDAQFKLLFSLSQLMKEELELQIAEKRQAEYVIAAQIGGALLVAVLVGLFTVLNVRRTVSGLQASVDQVRAGDDAALRNIESK